MLQAFAGQALREWMQWIITRELSSPLTFEKDTLSI